ncbi:MAG TPA: ring-cleaving dioxygenase [Gemmatimonadales bacterium]|nr:ring-cleaving dioxygenase [Gemmatimonadales bacterium]
MKQERLEPRSLGRLHPLALEAFVTKQVHTPETSLKHDILGLHHVTATVNDAQADLDFYRDLLGLRLVKKTVNFDNHSVYHFYYGDERGTPGTLWTTFPYKGWGVAPGRHGRGQITVTSFSVPPGSLDTWERHIQESDTPTHESTAPDGNRALSFADPSGLVIRLVEVKDDARAPWTGSGVSAERAIRGLHSVTMTLNDPAPTLALMTSVLGFQVVDETEQVTRLAVQGDGSGRYVDLVRDSRALPARNGLGTVHHVAMAIATGAEQAQLRQELMTLGYAVTDVLDRQYFQSIYFREPGGVLLEVATVEPGFTVDEPLAQLGCELKLPPWEESNRPAIEKSLPLVTRSAD